MPPLSYVQGHTIRVTVSKRDRVKVFTCVISTSRVTKLELELV